MRALPCRVSVSPPLTSLVAPAAMVFDGLVVRGEDEGLVEAMRLAAADVRAAGEPVAVTAAVRSMYRRVGIDPTKTRPSSEALLRRVRKGEPLPCVNTAVDVVNWCSLESQLPYGLYDRAAVRGDVTLRLGRPGESYAGIRKDAVRLEGRLTLADDEGPFGNPTSDSMRTMVTTSTVGVLVVIFAPASLPPANVQRAMTLTAERMARFCP